MFWDSVHSEPLECSFLSESAFMDGLTDAKDADAKGVRLMRMDSGAIRSGVLEKAAKDVAAWKRRRCALHPEAFWYSKDTTFEPDDRKESRAQLSKWTCIPLTSCIQLLRWPDDGRVFLIQTGSRSYYWRAKSQNEAEAWLLSIGTQCATIREMDLLRQAEHHIIRTEEAHTDACLEFLHSLYRLEGTLRFQDTRELLDGFLVDLFRMQQSPKTPADVEHRQPVTQPVRGPQLAVAHQKTDDLLCQQTELCGPIGAPQPVHDIRTAGFSLEEVRDFINAWASYHPDSNSDEVEYCEDAAKVQAEETVSKSDRRIADWLRIEIFPKFISSPIIRRRIAQLAASRNVMNWGIDPLKSPLLASNIFEGGC